MTEDPRTESAPLLESAPPRDPAPPKESAPAKEPTPPKELDLPKNQTSMKPVRTESDPGPDSTNSPTEGEIAGPQKRKSPIIKSAKFFFGGGDDTEEEEKRENNAVLYDVRFMSTRKKARIVNTMKGSTHQRRILIEIRKRRVAKTPRKSLPPAPLAESSPRSQPLAQSQSPQFVKKEAGATRAKTLEPGYPGYKASSAEGLDQNGEFDGVKPVSPIEFENCVKDGDELYLKVFKPISSKEARRMSDSAYDSDADSVSSSDDSDTESVLVTDSQSAIKSPKNSHGVFSELHRTIARSSTNVVYGWKKSYNLPLSQLQVPKSEKNKCLVTTKSGDFKKWIIFPTEEDRSGFQALVSSLQFKIQTWHEKHLEDEIKATNRSADRPVNLLVEIVAAKGLRSADIGSLSDPYVKVRLGDRVLHKTKRIDDTLNPIWTLETQSLFLISDSLKDFFLSGFGVTFDVVDYDVVGKHTSLGHVTVPQKVLLEATGERQEFQLEEAKSRKKGAGTLIIRCRRATMKDLQFMAKINMEKKILTKHGVANQSEFIKPVRPPSHIAKTMKKKSDEGNQLIRVRPHPDPERPTETKWMTANDLERAAYEESHKWVEGGTGNQGFLYVEIIGCDNLPNMDLGVNTRDKTDAFVTAIFEDAILSTDVVNDCLSPRFMPWTRRAFVFGIAHPWSPLMLGVHDYDSGTIDSHDPIGRVQVDLGNFAPKTEYILHYDLYNSAIVPDRKKFGTITIRLSLEYNDIRKLYTDSVSFPSRFHVNVQEKKDYRVAKFVADGGKNVTAYSLETITMHAEELSTIANMAFFIYNALMFIHEWKGHIPMRWKWPWGKDEEVEFLLPLHSIIAFIAAVLLVERPHFAPAIFTASIGWMMLAMLELKTTRASPWARPPTYLETAQALAKGERAPQKIKANENQIEDEIQVGAQEKKREAQVKQVVDAYNDKAKEWEAMAEFIGESGDLDNIESKSGKGFSTLPMRSVLYPYQVWLAQMCQVKRTIESILTWDSYIASFWITTASLGLGFVFMFIPWSFLILWTGRFVAWIVLGPWRYLAYKSGLIKSEMTIWERRERMKEAKAKKKEAFEKEMELLQIQKESALKLAALKKTIFGNFIVSCPCPMVKVDRYHDMPRPNSTAAPIPPENSMSSKVKKSAKTRLEGQKLEGDMIPENIDAHMDLPRCEKMDSTLDIMTLVKENKKSNSSNHSVPTKLRTTVMSAIGFGKGKKQ